MCFESLYLTSWTPISKVWLWRTGYTEFSNSSAQHTRQTVWHDTTLCVRQTQTNINRARAGALVCCLTSGSRTRSRREVQNAVSQLTVGRRSSNSCSECLFARYRVSNRRNTLSYIHKQWRGTWLDFAPSSVATLFRRAATASSITSSSQLAVYCNSILYYPPVTRRNSNEKNLKNVNKLFGAWVNKLMLIK